MREAVDAMPEGVLKIKLICYLPSGTPFDISMARAVIGTLTTGFPERLHRAYIFPCGVWSTWFWGVVRPFLAERTSTKMCFLNGGRKPPELCNQLGEDNVMRRFGGTLEGSPWEMVGKINERPGGEECEGEIGEVGEL